MDREPLRVWIEEEGLSLPQIGALVGRDAPTVGYWVTKYGLTANGQAKYAPQGGIDEEVLEILCEEGATLKEMAEELGRSISTIRYWLIQYGCNPRAGGRRRSAGRSSRRCGVARGP